MELRTRKAWAVALLAVAVMVLSPGGALADELEPGELKAITEGSAQVTDPAELKARMESFSVSVPVRDPGELKALMESGTLPQATGGETASTGASGVGWTGVGFASLVLLFTIGAAVLYRRSRHNHIAQA
jgi:hypothetical protein